MREVYLSDQHIQTAMGLFSKITLAFVGVGSPTSQTILTRDSSILTQEDLDDVVSHGAVGDIALHFIDRNGMLVPSEMDRRVVGIDLEDLFRVQRVVGVAGGPRKIEAIRAALRGKILDVLITDKLTAERLLQD